MKTIKLALAAAGLAAATALTAPAVAQDKLSLVVNVVQVFGTVDPAKVTDYTEYMAAVNLYDALTTVSSGGEVVPQLTESWEVSDDNRTYTFKLKQDATFQDGSPVEAKDVVYTMKRLLALNEGPAYLFSELVQPDNVKAIDDHTVEIRIDRVYAPFISVTPLILVVNSDVVSEKEGEWGEDYLAENSAGAGPYNLSGWTRGAEMILQRYENYHAGWPNDRPIDELRFVVTRDEATVRALAQRGELGMSSQYQSSETYEAIAALDNYKLIEAETTTGFYLKVNNQLAPTDDVHIRRAIAYAMDYDTIREVIYPGGEMKSVLSPLFSEAHLDTLPSPEFNLEKAVEEVAKSKYAGNQPIRISHAYVANTAFEEEIGLLFKSTLESIGFAVDLQPEPWNRLTELATGIETTPHTSQVFYGPTYPSPDSVFFVQYHSRAAGTWSSMSWVEDPQIDAMIDKSRDTVDDDARNAIYKDIQARVHDTVAEIPLLTQLKRMAAHSCLQGYAEVPMQSWDYDFSRMWWACEE